MDKAEDSVWDEGGEIRASLVFLGGENDFEKLFSAAMLEYCRSASC